MLKSCLLCSPGSKLSTLDMQHKIASADILHHEIYSCLGLEAGMKIRKKRVPLFVRNEEYPLLRFCAFHFVVLDDELLFEHFNGI